MSKGGARDNAGRKATGRQRFYAYVTPQEAKMILVLISIMRSSKGVKITPIE